MEVTTEHQGGFNQRASTRQLAPVPVRGLGFKTGLHTTACGPAAVRSPLTA